ncbi:FecR family protein [Mucilaginibacter sp.]|uniref:FecR family protein n=1 Tax=Mucilaginibacter sp. TaxID=1882438 RepID=UPI002ED007B5
MQQKDAKILFDKLKDGTITNEEKSVLDEWYLQYNEEDENELTERDYQIAEEKIWAKLRGNILSTPVKRLITWKHISIAASIALFLAFSILFLMHRPAPGMQDNNTQSLSRNISADQNNMIQLPDGSRVIVYKGGKLTYNWTSKNMKTREVSLTGRAFFDIKHDDKLPFIVRSGKVKTTVLGTAFDVSAEPGSDEISVRVIRGKVNVSTDKKSIGDLLPDKKVTYNSKTDVSSFATTKTEHEMQWVKQDMLLNDITFEAICNELESRYKVKINIESEDLKSKKFTISIRKDESLIPFLKTVCDFNQATFSANTDNSEFTITAVASN